ncbi:hypothetical protein [Thiococcus pfennigii]|uniref:gasdermin n=1 Tax=Thiococcus pfennigii TaxID=1057 RepID=UPI00190308D5|nr:hypothetical protein [Thiococcus pfennigii]MBK1733409.1 hypothetical protein [Thiococcus pfennigii]
MSRRDKADPLVRECLEVYGLNFLSVPRATADVGDCWLETPSGMLPPGRLSSLLSGDFELPEVTRGEDFKPAARNLTRALDLQAGLSLSDRFMKAVGVTGWSARAKAAFEASDARKIRIKIDNATRDALDVFQLHEALAKAKLKPAHIASVTSGRLYCAAAVVRATGITLKAEDRDGQHVAIEGELGNVVEAKAEVNRTRYGDISLVYRGEQPLAFGIELVELEVTEGNVLVVTGVAPAREIRKTQPEQTKQPLRTLIGDPEKGDVFVDLDSA